MINPPLTPGDIYRVLVETGPERGSRLSIAFDAIIWAIHDAGSQDRAGIPDWQVTFSLVSPADKYEAAWIPVRGILEPWGGCRTPITSPLPMWCVTFGVNRNKVGEYVPRDEGANGIAAMLTAVTKWLDSLE